MYMTIKFGVERFRDNGTIMAARPFFSEAKTHRTLESVERTVEKLPNFTHFDTWLKTAELTDAQKNYVIREFMVDMPCLCRLFMDTTARTKAWEFKNKRLLKIQEYMQNFKGGAVTDLVEQYKNSQEFKKIKKYIEEAEKSLQNKCPMLSFVSIHDARRNKDKVLNYINSNLK